MNKLSLSQSAMRRGVILRSDFDEISLGTVGELVNGDVGGNTGCGISLDVVFSDIVSDLIASDDSDGRRFIIELRDPIPGE